MLNRLPAIVACLLAGAVLWSYWPTLLDASERWANDPQYSHGYLVPLFSLYLLWQRRDLLAGKPLSPSLFGFAFLALAIGIRYVGTRFFLNGLDTLSLLPALAGVALVVGGWSALRWSWPAVGFLIFMVPLPYRLQTLLAGKLQSMATGITTYALQTLGFPAIAEGNVIVLDEVRIGVVEACSGLGMVVTFAALSVGIALMARPAAWVGIVMLLGALPVAVAANVFRIGLTAILYSYNQGEAAEKVFHDLAGWLMMPVGVVLIWLEMAFLNRLIIDRPPPVAGGDPLPIYVPTPKAKAQPQPSPANPT